MIDISLITLFNLRINAHRFRLGIILFAYVYSAIVRYGHLKSLCRLSWVNDKLWFCTAKK